MRPALKVALYIAAALLVLIGIVAAIELQLRDQRRMIDTVRADQIRALNARKVRQMIDDALSGRRPIQPHHQHSSHYPHH
jgi:CHASE3 domain sensor protein